MLLTATRIILIHPTLPENVGMAARAMGHFGLSDLRLVGGVAPMHPLAVAASAGHEAILKAARVVDTFEEALSGAGFVVGTTARPQDGVGRRAIAPSEAASLALAHAESAPVALAFGTEKDGMSNVDLRRCDQLATIPGTEKACLNLAQALTIMAYEWHQAGGAGLMAGQPLTAALREEGLDDLVETLANALAAANLLPPAQRESKLHTLRRIASGARLTPDEAAMLRGLARGYQKHKETSTGP